MPLRKVKIMLRRMMPRRMMPQKPTLRKTSKNRTRDIRLRWSWMRILLLSGLFGAALFFYLHSVAALWHPHPSAIGDTESHSIIRHHSSTGSPLLVTDPVPDVDASSVDVVRDFGAKGDGTADDTAAIQQAIDTVYGRGGGTIVFPPGTYVVTSVTLKENITYHGYGATVKRPAHQGNWTRTFAAHYAGNTDSSPLIIKGFTFDGNLAEQGSYRNYELEQAHLLFLMGDSQFPGRLKVTIEDCVFKNSAADGISVYTNVDIRVNNCEAIDVFRGGFVLTGGNSLAEVSNLTTSGERNSTGIDIEVDGRGYGNTLKAEIKLENIHLMNGDFDIGVADGSTVVGNNIVSGAPFNLYSLNSTMKFTHSQFKVGAADGYINRIVFPHSITFEDCEFIVTRQTTTNPHQFYAAADVWWQHPSQPLQHDQQLVFRNCSFEVDNTIRSTDLTYAVYLRPDAESNNNQLVIEGGSISDRFSTPVMQESLT